MCHLHSLWCGRRKLGAGSRVRLLLGVGPGSRAEWKEICWVRLITVMWGTWAGPAAAWQSWHPPAPEMRCHADRDGAAPEPRRRHGRGAPRVRTLNYAQAQHLVTRDTWRSPGSGGMQLPNYSELFARLREGTILASCCYNFDYETFVD